MNDNKKIYFENLDSIRFIAAFIVYLCHGMSPCYDYIAAEGTVCRKILNAISSGGAGVMLFFILSGFLITYLLMEEYEVHNKIALKNFYLRRVLRIWPLYFATIAFSFLFYPFLKNILGVDNLLCSNIWYHLSFLSNMDVINIESQCPLNGALSQNITWSVSVEEQFYLFWPLLFIVLPKRIWGYAILVMIAGSVLFRIINYNKETVLYYHTFAVLVYLGVGGMTAYLIRTVKKIRQAFEQTSTWTHLVLFLLGFGLLYWSGGEMLTYKYGSSVMRLLMTVVFAAIIAAQAFTKSSSPLNLRNFSFANKWGKYTYGIYLIHPMVLTPLMAGGKISGLIQYGLIYFLPLGIIGFLLTLLLSKLSFIYFESRFLELKKKFQS